MSDIREWRPEEPDFRESAGKRIRRYWIEVRVPRPDAAAQEGSRRNHGINAASRAARLFSQ